MPFTPTGAALAIGSGLLSTGHLGPGVVKLAAGVAAGCSLWLAGGAKPISVDAGAVGTGIGTIPLVVPPPLLLAGLTAGFAAQGIIGPFAPLTILGLSTGLATAFPQALILTNHPGVGVGTGIVTIKGSSAVPFMIQGFATAGMVTPGSIRKATAIGIGLDTAFAGFVIPTPILGGGGPVPSAGAGFGQIV